MIIMVDNNSTHWALEFDLNGVQFFLVAYNDVIDEMRLKILVVNCQVKFLLSELVLASEIVCLFD